MLDARWWCPLCLLAALLEGADTISLLQQLGPTALKTLGGLGIVLLGGRLFMRRWDGHRAVFEAAGCPGGLQPTVGWLDGWPVPTPPASWACRVFELVAEARSEETFIALCLLSVTGASLLTQRMGFSDTLGAFVAGVLLSGERAGRAGRFGAPLASPPRPLHSGRQGCGTQPPAVPSFHPPPR